MEFKNLREENPVDETIAQLKSGNFRKASIKLGQLRGSPEEFMRLFNYLTKDTRLEGAKLKIKAVPAKIACLSCDWRGDPDIKPNDVRCPRCLSEVKILKGHEFQITV
ncbi:MAG: hydrogenase maturation nickel metallochaperone HypA [Candidatus Aenigmarchaeota archaeon]|nr:hydrogenase maturation nickel metallochaperone HypA [Candidatus Aenigmarchaeota archaeon]